MLSARDILDKEDLKKKIIYIEEWDGNVRIQSMTAADAEKFKDLKDKDLSDSMVSAIIMSVVDEYGNPLFDQEHVEALKKKSIKAFMTIQNEVLKLNGFDDYVKTKNEAKND